MSLTIERSAWTEDTRTTPTSKITTQRPTSARPRPRHQQQVTPASTTALMWLYCASCAWLSPSSAGSLRASWQTGVAGEQRRQGVGHNSLTAARHPTFICEACTELCVRERLQALLILRLLRPDPIPARWDEDDYLGTPTNSPSVLYWRTEGGTVSQPPHTIDWQAQQWWQTPAPQWPLTTSLEPPVTTARNWPVVTHWAQPSNPWPLITAQEQAYSQPYYPGTPYQQLEPAIYSNGSMRRMSSDSDSSLGSGHRRGRGRGHYSQQASPPPVLAVYFHSVASQVEPPDEHQEVPDGFRVLGETANHRLIVERVNPWKTLAWNSFVRSLRLVGAIGHYIATGFIRCVCGLVITVFRFVARFICAIPRSQEGGPVHALNIQDYEPCRTLYNPPDVFQVGGTGPLLAKNPQEAEYTRRCVSVVAQPVQDLSPEVSPRGFEDASVDSGPEAGYAGDQESLGSSTSSLSSSGAEPVIEEVPSHGPYLERNLPTLPSTPQMMSTLNDPEDPSE